MATDEELIQKAIKTCRFEIDYWQQKLEEERKNPPFSILDSLGDFYITQLNSWKTHLAEILGLQEWLKDCEEGGSWSSPEEIESAIKFLLEKAKRLLGVE